MKLYNPTNDNFTITYDINGDGNPQSYTLHAGEIEEFEDSVAENIVHHLAHKMTETMKGKGTYEAAYEKAVKLITEMKELEL